MKKVSVKSSLSKLYGDDDLSSWELFQGGFINFGYWEYTSKHKDIHSRIESSKALYKKVLEKAKLLHSDILVDLGCGTGVGSSYAVAEFEPRKVIAIDASEDQLRRAEKALNKTKKRTSIELLHSCAESISLQPGSVNAVVSIEAFQHFTSIEDVYHSCKKILKPGGRFVISTFFTKDSNHCAKLKKLIPTIDLGIDKAYSISYIVSHLKQCGFENIEVEQIGEHVWEGFDEWIQQTSYKNSWNRNWLKAYKQDLIDYYTISSSKPIDNFTT